MGLFGFNKKKEYLLEWQKIVLTDSPDKLIMTERQLKQTSEQQATNDLRIIQDCIKIISNTVKPDIFFSRMDLLKEKAIHLQTLEPYVNFSGASPTAAVNEIFDQEQDAIYELIGRCYNTAFEKAEKLKTEKGKKNQYQKFYDSLQPYADKMNNHNINYLKYKIRDRL